MQKSLGEAIRQVRWFRHLTQRELAGERFSKSYVSGVEHQRITPSAEALLQRDYHTALGYHLHALHSSLKASDGNAAFLQVVIELHCGDDYQRLGAYHQALAHYESARAHLSAQHDLATTGKVYAGMGYLIYAALSTSAEPPYASALSPSLSPEQIEHDYQHANSFLHQGVSFYQASSDRWKEAITRLTQVSLLLDWSAWRQRKLHEQANWIEKQPSSMQCAPLLDQAQEHCRQVLLAWHEPSPNEEVPLFEIDSLLFTTIACLVRIALQRARLARLEAHSIHVAYRERAFAAYLCRLVLETLSLPSPAWEAARQATTQELLSVLEQAFWQFQNSLLQGANAHDEEVRAKGSC